MPNQFLQMLQDPGFWQGAAPALAQAGDPYAPNPILGALLGGRGEMDYQRRLREEEQRLLEEEKRKRQAEELQRKILMANSAKALGVPATAEIFGIADPSLDPILADMLEQIAATEQEKKFAEMNTRAQEREAEGAKKVDAAGLIEMLAGGDPAAAQAALRLEGGARDIYLRNAIPAMMGREEAEANTERQRSLEMDLIKARADAQIRAAQATASPKAATMSPDVEFHLKAADIAAKANDFDGAKRHLSKAEGLMGGEPPPSPDREYAEGLKEATLAAYEKGVKIPELVETLMQEEELTQEEALLFLRSIGIEAKAGAPAASPASSSNKRGLGRALYDLGLNAPSLMRYSPPLAEVTDMMPEGVNPRLRRAQGR